MADNPFEQHTLVDTLKHRTLLQKISLEGRDVIEIGVGTGVLTRLILEGAPHSVIGYEISSYFLSIEDPRLTVNITDFKDVDLSFINRNHCIISNPPYTLLEYIRAIISKYDIGDAILMVPERLLGLFNDFKIVFILDGNAFEPKSKGLHYVIMRGFIS